MYLSYIRECNQKKQRDDHQDGAIATCCHCCESETLLLRGKSNQSKVKRIWIEEILVVSHLGNVDRYL